MLAHAEGNPFFLEEMLNMLIDQGVLERRNGGWVSAAGWETPGSRTPSTA